MERAEDALQLLCDRKSKVSAHYLIDEEGRVFQLVDEHRRAWHAGASTCRGQQQCNDFSIGIELEGEDSMPYADAQYDVVCELIQTLIRTYPSLGPRRIAGHCDVAQGRKSDPGPAFDWMRLYDGLRVNP